MKKMMKGKCTASSATGHEAQKGSLNTILGLRKGCMLLSNTISFY